MDQRHRLNGERVEVDQCPWLDGEVLRWINATGSTKERDETPTEDRNDNDHKDQSPRLMERTLVKEMMANEGRFE